MSTDPVLNPLTATEAYRLSRQLWARPTSSRERINLQLLSCTSQIREVLAAHQNLPGCTVQVGQDLDEDELMAVALALHDLGYGVTVIRRRDWPTGRLELSWDGAAPAPPGKLPAPARPIMSREESWLEHLGRFWRVRGPG
jgi:hypothetical protein